MGASAALLAFPRGDEIVVGPHAGYSEASMDRWHAFPLAAPLPLSEAVRSGQPVFVSTLDDWAERYPAMAPEVIMPGLAVVPFVFHGQTLGAMTLSFRDPRRFSGGDKSFLLAIGRQCAQALERARLYEQRAYVARTLQEGLLPDSLPEVAGVEIAVRYASIADGGEVGGDFYDVLDITDERYLAVVGDVCGKGTAAAVLTGLARHTLRAIALREEDPAEMLRFLNEALRRQGRGRAFCTVAAAAFSPAEDGRVGVELVSGGHPAPVVVRAGGAVEVPDVGGTMLGVDPEPDLRAVESELAAGDALVLYTDGVTDAGRGQGEPFGDARLHAALSEAAQAGADADGLANAVEAAVAAYERGGLRDDRAVLVLRVT
jgi:serine phosphatase RsbU (regulator of sigma subunit)